MSGKGGSGKGLPVTTIPPSSKKIVQSLKEILTNFPEHEIYAMLRDCNMDPNETVNRLLSQDPFHEVKSKREKKKENKDPTDYRSYGSGTSSTTSRGGGRGGTDRHGGHGVTNHYSSIDSGLLGKTVHKKENGIPAYGGSLSSTSSVMGINENRQPPSHSSSEATEKTSTIGINDGLSSSSQYGGGPQSAWKGNVVGQVSMADIVKRGRPQAKASVHDSSFHSGNRHNGLMPSEALDHSLQLPQHASMVSETNTDQGSAISHSVPQNNEWPCIENQQDVRVYNVVDVPEKSDYYENPSSFSEAYWQKDDLDERLADDGYVEIADDVRSASTSVKSSSEDNTGGDGVSSVAANLEQLNLQRDDQGTKPEEDDSSIIIPSHLQLHTPECLNLSFGRFGSQNNAPLSGSGPYNSRSLKSNVEDTHGTSDVSATGSSDARNPNYYGDEHHASTSEGSLAHPTGVSSGTYEHSSISQQEDLKLEHPETAQQNLHSFPSSSHGFTYGNALQNVTFPHSQISPQMQNLAPFSSVMAYANSLPDALLASTTQTAREDIPYLPFPATQPMPAKLNNIASSFGDLTITMSEALRASSISTPQPNPHTLTGANVATGPTLPQHLAMHPYSQPTLPLGHFANMISYPLLPQSYAYMPSAFQQTFAGNNAYHQSLAALLPQYKSSVSVSNVPPSANIPPGYGFNSSTSIPGGGSFSLNPPAAATGTTIGYENVINSQLKDNSHMISLQQNENSPIWLQGPGSRTMPAVPPSAYYSLQGQNQQPSGFQQRQQPTQHFGSLGHPNFYQSQSGISLEHQHQNSLEASLGGLQSQPSQQSQQLWQNSY
ncbi:uncharacterized protein [Cicer arietinum]|uniref:Uncharacterized protein LOC101513958 isoform X2 n=1 Tax=Cicer arietinum TaxID=3827 RepID=A0A1S3E4F8_CICAR|nr:uncharacterized protein LOC101513958 isoform X2 [Cicer arietinum]